MNRKVTTSYTIAHTVSGTVLVERKKYFSEVRTPRHLLLLDATLMRFYNLKLKIIISIAGYPRTAKTHLENDILPSPAIDLTQLQLRQDFNFKS